MVPNFGYVVQREMTKSQMFLRSESRHESRVFPAKKQISDWLTYLVYQLEACFFGGKPFELMFPLGSQEKLTLVSNTSKLSVY